MNLIRSAASANGPKTDAELTAAHQAWVRRTVRSVVLLGLALVAAVVAINAINAGNTDRARSGLCASAQQSLDSIPAENASATDPLYGAMYIEATRDLSLGGCS